MIFKILYVILLVTVCSGAPPAYPQTKSNRATYSQSFVREDVPMSYQYSAIHYYAPKKDETSNEVNPIRNFNNPAAGSVRNKTIQFAPLPHNPREYSYPTAPVLYTSIISDPASQYGKYELTENSAESVLPKYNLEPKVLPFGNNINPSTYKPHMNHDIKIFHSERLRPNNHRNLNTPTTSTIETTPDVNMGGNLHANLFQLLEQQLIQETIEQAMQPTKNAPSINAELAAVARSTTELPIFSHVRNLGVSVLPKRGTPFTIPHEFYGNTPFQPIQRIAYHNKVHVVPEKQGRLQMHASHRIHMNKSKMH